MTEHDSGRAAAAVLVWCELSAMERLKSVAQRVKKHGKPLALVSVNGAMSGTPSWFQSLRSSSGSPLPSSPERTFCVPVCA